MTVLTPIARCISDCLPVVGGCVCVGRAKGTCDAPGSELDAEPLRSRPHGSDPSGLLCSKEDFALPPRLYPRLQALRQLVEEVGVSVEIRIWASRTETNVGETHEETS